MNSAQPAAYAEFPQMPATPALYREFVGDNLRTAIEATGHSQAAVARAIGVSPSRLGNWLRGDNFPNPWEMRRFCDLYGVTMDWLYRRRVYGLPAELAAHLASAAEASSAEP
jgi:transcriptional regulator with XRE-family HTH domain